MVPGISHFPEGQIIAMALIFLRIVAFMVSWPVFGISNVPVHVKVLLAIVLSMMLLPIIKFQNVDLVKINDQLIFISIRELFIGLFMGFLLRFFFFAVSMAGELLGISSGLSSAQLFNPAMGGQTNVLEQVELVLATLFLLAMNGHHLFLQGLAKSFDLLPVAAVGIRSEGFSSISLMLRDAFVMGLKMASPVIVAVFITNLTMGLLGRAVPQLNVMMTGFQVTIGIAFIVFFISMPLFVDELSGLMQLMSSQFFAAMKVL